MSRIEELLAIDPDGMSGWSVRDLQSETRALQAEVERLRAEHERELGRARDLFTLQLEKTQQAEARLAEQEHEAQIKYDRLWDEAEAIQARLAKVVEALQKTPGYTPGCSVCGAFAVKIAAALAAAKEE